MNKNLSIVMVYLLVYNTVLFASHKSAVSDRAASYCNNEETQTINVRPSLWNMLFYTQISQAQMAVDPEQSRKEAFRKRAAAQEARKPRSLLSRYCCFGCMKKTPEQALKKGAKHQFHANDILKTHYGWNSIKSEPKSKLTAASDKNNKGKIVNSFQEELYFKQSIEKIESFVSLEDKEINHNTTNINPSYDEKTTD